MPPIEVSEDVLALVRSVYPDEDVAAAIERIIMASVMTPERLTEAEAEMLATIVEVEGNATISSLFQFLEWYIADYATAWRRLSRLELAGMVTVTRNGNGRPMTFRATERGRAITARRDGKVKNRQLHLKGF